MGDIGGNRETNTGGGANFESPVSVAQGDFVARDKIIQQAAPTGVDARHQLPSPPADFTGREAELSELRAARRVALRLRAAAIPQP